MGNKNNFFNLIKQSRIVEIIDGQLVSQSTKIKDNNNNDLPHKNQLNRKL